LGVGGRRRGGGEKPFVGWGGVVGRRGGGEGRGLGKDWAPLMRLGRGLERHCLGSQSLCRTFFGHLRNEARRSTAVRFGGCKPGVL